MASSSERNTEPFPTLPRMNETQPDQNVTTSEDERYVQTYTSSPKRSRGTSLVQSFIHSNPPLGMWQATGEVGSKFPTLPEIKNGEFSDEGWSQEGQMERRGTNPHDIHRITRARRSSASTRTRSTVTPKGGVQEFQFASEVVEEEPCQDEKPRASCFPNNMDVQNATKEPVMINLEKPSSPSATPKGPDTTGTYPNGYRFPKKHTWGQSINIGLKAFWKFFLTPMGFLITIYGLNVIGWGAMIFFVLLEAVSPGMCVPTCTDINSPRQIWIEIDSQVLNGLFCVTGFGLIPWRFRDFYYLMKWRIGKDHQYHRKLAGIYRGWYRLPGSQKLPDNIAPPPFYSKKHPQTEDAPPPYSQEEMNQLEQNEALPIPATSIPDPPLTGLRATPTKSWKLDLVIWMYVLNTLIQAALAGIMWGLTRHTRPSWATGFLISIGCITGIVAGIVVFIEGSKVKKIEGIPVKEYDVLESIDDYRKRKLKEEAKKAKKTAKQVAGENQGSVQIRKVKGESWFTRH